MNPTLSQASDCSIGGADPSPSTSRTRRPDASCALARPASALRLNLLPKAGRTRLGGVALGLPAMDWGFPVGGRFSLVSIRHESNGRFFASA